MYNNSIQQNFIVHKGISIRQDTMQQFNSMFDDCKRFQQNLQYFDQMKNRDELKAQLSCTCMQPLIVPEVNMYFPFSACPHLFETSYVLREGKFLTEISALTIILSMMLHATRGRIVVKLEDNWIESASEFAMLISPSGTYKSAILTTLREPFEEFLAENKSPLAGMSNVVRQEFKKEMMSELRKKMKKEIHSLYDGIQGTDELYRQLVDINDVHNSFDSTEKTMFISSFTLTQFAQTLSEQGEAISIAESEGDLLKILKDDELVALLLRSYSGEPWTRQSTRSKVSLSKPSVQIMLLLQELAGSQLFNSPKWVNNGLAARFLPLFSSNHVQKLSLHTDMKQYKCRVLNVLKQFHTLDPNREIYTIGVEDDALVEIKSFHQEMLSFQCQFPEDAHAFIKRAHGHAVRLALAYHIWIWSKPHKAKITIHEMQVGIAIIRNLLPHILYAYSPCGFRSLSLAKAIEDNLRKISQREWEHFLHEGISATEIQKRLGKHAEPIRNALELLQQHNYVRIYDKGDTKHNVILHPNFYGTYNTINNHILY